LNLDRSPVGASEPSWSDRLSGRELSDRHLRFRSTPSIRMDRERKLRIGRGDQGDAALGAQIDFAFAICGSRIPRSMKISGGRRPWERSLPGSILQDHGANDGLVAR
jgi:hypothetical protein